MNSTYQSLLPNNHRREVAEQSALLSRKSHDDCESINADATANADTDINESWDEMIGKHMKKRPTLVLSVMLLLACTVGHTLTVMYFWDNIKQNASDITGIPSAGFRMRRSDIDSAALTLREMEKKSKKEAFDKAQDIANQQLKNELVGPTLESEAHYNKTYSALVEEFHHEDRKDYPFMGSSKSSDPPASPPPNGCQTTVMILRHCEKGGVREHCNSLGFERAQYISTLFGNGDEKWPSPTRIYALNPGDRNNDKVENYREVETVTPLSQKLNVTIDDSYGINDTREFAKKLFTFIRSDESCGKIVLIAWKHSEIPTLAHTLGCGPDQGCPLEFDEMDFDSVWEIRYSYKKAKYAPFPEAEAKKHKNKPWGILPKWWVYGKVEQEDFDPLAFSKVLGSYNATH